MKKNQHLDVLGWAIILLSVFLSACGDQVVSKNEFQKPTEYQPYQLHGSNIENRAINADEFTQTVFPLLNQHCAGCHSTTAALPAFPLFADSNPIIAFPQLYNTGNVDLIQPANSKIVTKLSSELHNCWSVDCIADAQAVQLAIEDWVVMVNVGQDVYTQLCAECHGINGAGMGTTVGLTRNIPVGELTAIIETTMPTADPTLCVDLCASGIAQYIVDNFTVANAPDLHNPLAGFPQGQAQLDLLCADLNARPAANVVKDAFCGATRPQITGITDLQAALGLAFTNPNATGRRNNGRRGNPAFTLVGHSSSLVARFVSAINPRALIFTPAARVNGNRVPNPGFVAMGFVRGDQFAEVVTSDRNTGELTFYLVTFKQACNLTDSCVPGDLLTPAVESNWIEYTVYSQTDLQNTVLDCLQCHQTGGPGTGSILRMQELRNPWTHFFRNNRPGGVALLNDFVAAHGTAENYAGIPAQLIDASDPAELEDLIRGNGFRQPNEFRSARIEDEVSQTPGQPANNDIPGTSATWQTLYNRTVQGQFIAVPYHDVKVTDSAKLAAMTAAYQSFLNGTLAAADLPDIREVFLDSMLPDIGFRVMSGLDGQQIIAQSCTQCHNSQLNQNISRAKFNVDLNNMSDAAGGILTGAARDAEISLAIARLTLAPDNVRKMPPDLFRTLDANEILSATSYLCSQMTVQGPECVGVPAFVAAPAALPSGANVGGGPGPGAGGGFPGFGADSTGAATTVTDDD